MQTTEAKRLWMRKKRAANPDFAKAHHVKKYWPTLTASEALAEYRKLQVAQSDLCAICHRPETQVDSRFNKQKTLAVDHCHKTGKVRALLCQACNHALGALREDFDAILRLAKYVQDHNNAL